MTKLVKEWGKEIDSLQSMAKNISGYQRAVDIAAGIKNLQTQIREFETTMMRTEYSGAPSRRDEPMKVSNQSRPERLRQPIAPRKAAFRSIDVKIAF